VGLGPMATSGHSVRKLLPSWHC